MLRHLTAPPYTRKNRNQPKDMAVSYRPLNNNTSIMHRPHKPKVSSNSIMHTLLHNNSILLNHLMLHLHRQRPLLRHLVQILVTGEKLDTLFWEGNRIRLTRHIDLITMRVDHLPVRRIIIDKLLTSLEIWEWSDHLFEFGWMSIMYMDVAHREWRDS